MPTSLDYWVFAVAEPCHRKEGLNLDIAEVLTLKRPTRSGPNTNAEPFVWLDGLNFSKPFQLWAHRDRPHLSQQPCEVHELTTLSSPQLGSLLLGGGGGGRGGGGGGAVGGQKGFGA